MTWNYRLMRYSSGGIGIHEVFYDDAGVPASWTERAVGLVGVDLEDIRSGLSLMAMSLDKPVLDYE